MPARAATARRPDDARAATLPASREPPAAPARSRARRTCPTAAARHPRVLGWRREWRPAGSPGEHAAISLEQTVEHRVPPVVLLGVAPAGATERGKVLAQERDGRLD